MPINLFKEKDVAKFGNGGKVTKKQLVIVGISILLLVVGLSGCVESDIEIIDWSVKTYFQNCGTCPVYDEDGFYNNTEDFNVERNPSGTQVGYLWTESKKATLRGQD